MANDKLEPPGSTARPPTDPGSQPPEDAELEEESEVERGVRQRVEKLIPDLVKRTFYAGLGAVMTTEEGIRKVTKDMSLPKDAANYLANTASSAKDEMLRIMAREVREFLQTVNLSEEIAKMLTTLSFEIKTEIRFIPNDQKLGGVQPDVDSKVRLKRADGGEKAEQGRGRRRRGRRRDEDDSEQ